MRLRFGLNLDGACWPGELAGRAAVLGERTVGERGLLQILETHTGLKGPELTATRRCLQYLSALRSVNQAARFFSSSLKEDPLGVARDLLALRNELRMAGWDGKAVNGVAKLEDLAEVEQVAVLRTELPDRILALIALLEDWRSRKRSLPVVEIELLDPISGFEPLWQRLLTTLQSSGVRLIEQANGSIEAPRISAQGDVRVLRSRDPWAAADWVSTYLSQKSDEDLKQTVLIVPDASAPILARALRSRGVPFGATLDQASASRPSVQLALASLQLAFVPRNPFAAKALLLQPETPVWGGLKRRLLGALDRSPAIGGLAWGEAIGRYVESQEEFATDEDPARSLEDVRKRLGWFFGPEAKSGGSNRITGLTAGEVVEGLAELKGWLSLTGERLNSSSYKAASALISEFCSCLQVLAESPESRFPEDELIRLFVDVAGSGVPGVFEPDEAGGPAVVSSPEKILAPCGEVIWWDFTSASAGVDRERMWLASEIAAMREAGIRLQDPQKKEELRQRHWLRPVLASGASMLAVVPGVDASGEPQFAHPVLDYLLPSTKKERDAIGYAITIDPRQDTPATQKFFGLLGVSGVQKVVQAWPEATRPTQQWQIPPASVEPRESYSYSSLEKLLGCSLAYVLDYHAGLEDHERSGLDEGGLLAGKVAHAVFERIFVKGAPPLAQQVSDQFEPIWSAVLLQNAQHLLLDSQGLERQQLRERVLSSAQEYAAFLRDNALEVMGSEQEIEGTVQGRIPLTGRMDQLLSKDGRPVMVVDLKWGGRADRRLELEGGSSLQLALYAEVAKHGTEPLQIGYFIIKDAQMLVLNAEYRRSVAVLGRPVSLTVASAVSRFDGQLASIARGELEAPGLLPPEALQTEWLPPCHFCSYSSICGKRWGLQSDGASDEEGEE